MTLPASGAISLNQVNVELNLSGTAQISLNDSVVRNLFGVGSGAISMSDGYGKANQFAFSIAGHQTNADLRTLAINAGWNSVSKVIATINSGIYISSNGTGTPALTVGGSFPNGVELTNNGYIVGRGGNGGSAVYANNGGGGAGGGLALSVSTPISIRNNQTIGGGGGGGGAGGAGRGPASDAWGGGGGGGGGRSSLAANSSGGSGIGGYGGSAAGGSGTYTGAGGGGSGGVYYTSYGDGRGGAGGTGGNWGANGNNGSNGSGYVSRAGGGGGGAGGAITGNGNISWLATGTRLGGIS